MKAMVALIGGVVLVNSAIAGDGCQLVANLKAGKKQVVVTYGTSLTAGGAWVGHLRDALNKDYPGLATVINSGQNSMWSGWGVSNLESRVIAKKPDTVFIEFAMNDAFLEYKTSLAQARSNLVIMIDRILASNPGAEIIVMTMNPPRGVHLSRRPKIADYYQMYRDVARERHLMLIDHDAAWQPVLEDKARFAKLVPDLIHPSAEGCAQVITPAIFKALGLPKEP